MPILHLDSSQPHRLRIEAAAFQDDALKQAGAGWRGRGHDYWHIAKALAPIYALKGIFGADLQFSPEVIEWLQETNIEWVHNALFLRGIDAGDTLANTPCENLTGRLKDIKTAIDTLTPWWDSIGFKLRNFQFAGSAMLVNSRGAILADDLGTGKSVMGAAAITIAQQAFGDAIPALVIAPKSTLTQAWVKAFTLCAPHLKVMVLAGDMTKRRKLLAKFTADGYHVLITSYGMIKAHSRSAAYGGTALKRCEECGGAKSAKPITPEKCETHLKELNGIAWQTIIVDEAHHIFAQTSSQTRAIHGVANTSKALVYRWPMTGTAVEGSPMDWWSLLKFAAPDEYGSSVTFRDRYVETRQNYSGFLEILGLHPNTAAELRLATAPRYIRRLKAEVLSELPPQVDIVREVELSAKERKQYNAFREELIVPMAGGDLFALNPAVAFGRLMSLACSMGEVDPTWKMGPNGDPEFDFGLTPAMPSSLLDEVEADRTGEYAGRRIVMSFASRKLLELYAAEFLDKHGVPYSAITGTVTAANRTLAMDKFNAGQTNLMLLTSAGGEGISLTDCDIMFTVTPETSRIKFNQMRDRLHGIGRGKEGAESILYVQYMPKDTVIEGVYFDLKRKDQLADDVLGDSARMRQLLATNGVPEEFRLV